MSETLTPPKPEGPKLHPLENPKTWIIVLAAFIVLGMGSITAFAILTPDEVPPTPTPTPIPVVISTPPPHTTSTPHSTPVLPVTPPPRTTPGPGRTPPPIPTPPFSHTPTPIQRWCETINNETICHEGVQPTPTPTPTPPPVPTPTPTPIPAWQKAGMKCEVPDRLLSERWVAAYKYPCTCSIRAQYNLGMDFSPFEGCHSTSAWAQGSCTCVETICKTEKGLC